MNNIIIKLCGGLGNQMLQYAYGRALSLQYNMNLILDKSFLERKDTGVTLRDYNLDIFNINPSFDVPLNTPIRVIEPHFHYSVMLANLPEIHPNSDIYVDGYFQSYKYFESFKSQICKDFTINWDLGKDINTFKDEILNTTSVSIHVRRGDYLKTAFHGTMEMDEYYNKAIDIIERSVSDPTYYIFSEDIEWCKANFTNPNMIIVDSSLSGEKSEGHFELMRSCKHHIIANSSFSWWTAYLSENVNKIIISPKKWFNDSKVNTDDLIPDSWLSI